MNLPIDNNSVTNPVMQMTNTVKISPKTVLIKVWQVTYQQDIYFTYEAAMLIREQEGGVIREKIIEAIRA